jgi:phospholipid/cholesterol/gamma-HCH transport system permease protein
MTDDVTARASLDSNRHKPERASLFVAVGLAIRALSLDVGAMSISTSRAVTRALRLSVSWPETLRQSLRLLSDAAFTVFGASVVIGGVVAMQGLNYIARYQATEVFGWAAALSSFRDVGPLLLGLALAARTGTKNATELATLVGRRRLEALRGLGVDVEGGLVLPRVFACLFVALACYPFGCLCILSSSFVFAFLIGGQHFGTSYHSMATYTHAVVVQQGLLRMLLFGLVIGLASTHAARQLEDVDADTSARGLGLAVCRSTVLCFSFLVVINAVLSLLGGMGGAS